MPYGSALMGIIGAGGSNNLVTTLYTGTALARSIVTGQNQSAQGALVWIKNRDSVGNHTLVDTARGATKTLESNNSNAQGTEAQSLTAFNSNGFSLGTETIINASGQDFVAWSFLKKAGFMDIVTWTGDGAGARNISHNLGVAPAMMIAKRLDSSSEWPVQHSSAGTGILYLNQTTSYSTSGAEFNDSAPTSSVFTVGNSTPTRSLNASGATYIAYLFAHNPAQKIYCGSFTTDGSGNATVTGLGFKPRWLMFKRTDGISNWWIIDVARGWGAGDEKSLQPNSSNAEDVGTNFGAPTSDGFTFGPASASFLSANVIYMAVG